MTELTRVYEPLNCDGKPRLVFIHGLDGDARKTWMSNPKDPTTLWPVWVGEATGCPVWLLGYGAAMSRWKADAMALPRQATAVLERLSNEPKLLDGPVVLIGHSLGGLVIKTAMQHAMSRDVERHKAVAKGVRGIVFVGTPHFGSRLATIAAWAHLMRANPQVRNLGLDDANLETLNDYFLKLRNDLGFRTRVFVETQPVRLPWWLFGRFLPGVTIVSPMSSQAHIPNEVGIPVEANHINICKPLDRRAAIHLSLVAFVREVQSEEAHKTPAPKTAIGSALRSDQFQTIAPDEMPDTSVHLAFATCGLSLDAPISQPVCTSVCLVTDSPDQLRDQLLAIRSHIRQDPLIPAAAKAMIDTAPLRDLVTSTATQAVVLRELAVSHFSAYLYYAKQAAADSLSTAQRLQAFVVEPLIHRLSKQGEQFQRIHSELAEIEQYVATAAQEVHARFHRGVACPKRGGAKYRPLEELSGLISWSAAQHLADVTDLQASTIFESLRTRIRFAQNVVTGETHKRDVNPLP